MCLGVTPDNTKLVAWLEESRFIVETYGTEASISEIAEQLAWLGAALRSSPYESGIAWCTPFVNNIVPNNDPTLASETTPDIICKIDFIVEKDESTDPTNGQCWHNMFRNPVVVKGYPISRRSELETGLEIPLNLMAGLTGTERVNRFNGKLFIKGFSSMLVPTKHNGDVLMWHLLYNQDKTRISYLDVTVPHAANISVSDLETSRHVLGWCSEGKYYAGKNIVNVETE